MTDRIRITEPSGCARDAAPYLLGALEPDEAEAYVRHLERCAPCRDEVAALAPALDALSAAAPPHSAPRGLRRRVLRAARAEPKAGTTRRRRRLRGLVASPQTGWLALGAAMVAAAVVQLGPTGSHERVIPASVGQAELRVSGDHSELVVEHLAALPANRTYELWLQSGRRTPAPSTLFAVSTDGRADIGVPGDPQTISRVLVTVEPRDGSLVPTTPAVIQVPLSYVRRS
jgi:anti-sigma-K factor RskA